MELRVHESIECIPGNITTAGVEQAAKEHNTIRYILWYDRCGMMLRTLFALM